MEKRFVKYQGEMIEVQIDEKLAAVLDMVASNQRGRFAFVSGHVSGLGDKSCLEPAVSDKWFISNPDYKKYLARKSAALLALGDEDEVAACVTPAAWDEIMAKRGTLTIGELFRKAKAELLASIVTTQAGDRTDGFRTGHDACYAFYDGGDVQVKLHLYTEKDAEGHMRPAPINGMFLASSVMLPYFLLNKRVISVGSWKPVNSRGLTLMKDGIEKTIARLFGVQEWTNLSLGAQNFASISLNTQQIKGLVPVEMRQAAEKPVYAQFLRDICGLNRSILEQFDSEATVSVH